MNWNETARHVDDLARQHFGMALTGTYVHGSAVLGGWVPGRSDVDLLVVCRVQPSEEALNDFARGVEHLSHLPDVPPIELSVILETLASRPLPPYPFLLHQTTFRDDCKVVRDQGAGDPDLLMHLCITHAAGVTISGPPVREVFTPPERQAVLAYLTCELNWGLQHATEQYAVLNACRALAYAWTGEFLSKIQGGTWGLEHLPTFTQVIQVALNAQRNGVTSTTSGPEAHALVEFVLEHLNACS